MAARLVVVCMVVSLLAACSSGGGSIVSVAPQWTRERADSFNSGTGASLIDNATGTLRWCRNLGASIRTTGAIGTAGTVYVGTDGGNLYALAPDDGATQWMVSVGQPVRSSPAVDVNDSVFFGDDGGLVHGLDAAGNDLWPAFDTQASGGARSPVRTSPLLITDFVESRTTALFIGTDEGRVVALGAVDGAPRWEVSTAAPIAGSLAMDANATIFAPSLNEELLGLAVDGSNPYPPPGAVSVHPITAPIIDSGGVIQVTGSSDGHGHIVALTPDLSGTRWNFTTPSPLTSPPTTVSEPGLQQTVILVLVVDAGGSLYAVNETTGAPSGLCAGGDRAGLPCAGESDCAGGICGPIFSVNEPVVAAPVAGTDGTVVIATAPDSGNGARVYAVQRRLCLGGNHQGELCQADVDCAGTSDETSGTCQPADEPADDPNQDGNPFVATRWVFSGDADCAGAGHLGSIVSPPSIAADGTIYFGTEDGYFYALNGNQ